MIDLYRMMMQAQGGDAMANLAHQFGVSQAQAQAAMEAMLPAFSTSLKRNTDDPMGLNAFLKAVGSGNHLNYYEDAMAAFSPAAFADGDGILGHLFGDKDVSRAVADQAAAMTGIGTELMKQMLPVLASMMMGGLARQGTGAANPMQQMFEQMMGGGRGGANPLGDMLQGMLGNMFGGAGKAPAGQGGFNPAEIMDALFTAGRKTQDANTEAMGRIFDQFTGGKR